jgi:hypothetical protein
MKACANCGVSLADDQRYCLECGTRQVQARSQFLERFTPAAVGAQPSASAPLSPAGRSANTTALAGIGVLLLAMGVGVLIGRASNSAGSASPQVISVASPAVSNGVAPTGAGTEATGAPTKSTEPTESHANRAGKGSANPSSPSFHSSSSGKAGKTSSSGAGKSSGSSSGSSNSGHNAEQKSLSLPNVVTTG